MNTTGNYHFLIASNWTPSRFTEAHLVVKFGEILDNKSLLIFMRLLILWFSIFSISLPSVHSRCESIRLFSKCPCLWLSWLSLPAAFLILLHLSLEMGWPQLPTVLSTQTHQGFIWGEYEWCFTFIFIIFLWIQSWIFLSSSEHKSDTSIKLYIPMARSHFQVAVVNSKLGTVCEKSKLGFSPQVPHFKFIYSEFHLSFYCRHSMSSGSSAIHTQPLSLVPWII